MEVEIKSSGDKPTCRRVIARDKLSEMEEVPQPKCRTVSLRFVWASRSQIAWISFASESELHKFTNRQLPKCVDRCLLFTIPLARTYRLKNTSRTFHRASTFLGAGKSRPSSRRVPTPARNLIAISVKYSRVWRSDNGDAKRGLVSRTGRKRVLQDSTSMHFSI